MRATYTTSYIYDGAPGYRKRTKVMRDILDANMPKTHHMIGQLVGITKDLNIAEDNMLTYIETIVNELSGVTIVPFNIVWLLENGSMIHRKVTPRGG